MTICAHSVTLATRLIPAVSELREWADVHPTRCFKSISMLGRRNGIAVNTIVNQPQNNAKNVAASMRDFPSLIPEIPLPTRLKTNRFERGQGGVGAVDLVAAGPPCGSAGIEGLGDHLRGQLGLGGELHLQGAAGGA